MTLTDNEVAALQQRWASLGEETELSLKRLARDVRDLLGASAPTDSVRAASLQALLPLLKRGTLRAVDLKHDGTFEDWSGTPEEQVARMDLEWRQLDRGLAVGDIAWFVGAGRSTW